MDSPSLTETLRLERLELNLFRGTTPDAFAPRIYGGQVISQSLLAAYETVEGRVCHSLHCYFLRPGDPKVPIIFDVDRSRDGGSFTTRRVVAIQHGQQIFNLAASFMAPEPGLDHQATMPDVASWRTLPDRSEEAQSPPRPDPDKPRSWMSRHRPIEVREVASPDGPTAPQTLMWFRAREPIGEGPHLHQVALAYASDMGVNIAGMRPHGVNWQTPGLQGASLDHAMWFHKPTDFNGWHLYVLDSPSASGGRGFIRGSVYAEDGTLVASMTQEGLMRMRTPKP